MYDAELALELLKQIQDAAQKVVHRFQAIQDPADFTASAAGVEKMDAICMMLIVIGEGLKKLDKVTDHDLLCNYPGIDWKKAKGMRDIITHHYADINAETVYYTCKKKIPGLLQTIENIIKDLNI